jgi:hypothetical protein
MHRDVNILTGKCLLARPEQDIPTYTLAMETAAPWAEESMNSEEAVHILLHTHAVGPTLREPEDIRHSTSVISLPLTR